MPGNFRTHLFPYQQDIPDVCFPETTAALKTRLKLDGGLASMVATATSNGNLMIFFQRKLFKSCQLPFRDCCQILCYRCSEPGISKEFLIALSFTKGAVVIDLQTLSSVKLWPDAKKIEVKDENLLGCPQVIVYFKEDLGEKIVVSQDSNWEIISQHQQPSLCENDSAALNNVVQALETQLKNVQENLMLMEKQILLRQSIVNRSLAALNDSVMCKANKMQAPSYTTKINIGDITKNSTFKSTQEVESPSLVEVCGVWHFTDHLSDSWVVGAAFTNTSAKTLHDIQCFFVPNNENVNYRICYYCIDSKVDNGFPALLESSSEFNGRLEQNCGLVVIVKTPIPRFASTEEEIGSLFLTCKLSTSPVKQFQLNLGCVRLKFTDVCSQNMEFSPSTHEIVTHRRNVLGLISLLEKEDTILLSTTVSPAFRSFKRAAKQLEMQHLKPMQDCFYSTGVCGHVLVFILDHNPNQVQMKIFAQSERKLRWFEHQMKSVLSDDCKFTDIIDNTTIAKDPTSRLHSALSLLSNAEVADEDEPSVIEEASTLPDSVLDNIRREFLRKQGKVLGMAQGRPGSFKIPIDQYRKWQHHCFV